MRVIILGFSVLAIGCGGGSSSSAPPAPPSAPTGVKAELSGDSAKVSWQSSGADKYHLYYATEPGMDIASYAAYEGGTWVQDVSSPELVVIVRGPEYYFAVTAVKGDQESNAKKAEPLITRYQAIGSSAVDVVTGLEWRRCSAGYVWDGSNCTGDMQRFNYSEASAYARNEGDGWRLPTATEAQSLVYCSSGDPGLFPNQRCATENPEPAIYSLMLPDVTDAPTPYYWLNGYNGPHNAIRYSDGDLRDVGSNSNLWLAVRLVRG